MALSGTVLGALIKTNVDAVVAAKPPNSPISRDELFQAIGNAIVTHITANAQVIVASVSGVTTGPGTSGPGTGTIL